MAERASAALPLRLPRSLDPAVAARLVALAASLPFHGRTVSLRFAPQLHAHRGRLRSGEGPGDVVHAATFLRSRRMVLASELLDDTAELHRIFVHELFHFAWPRLGNPRRRRWEALILEELRRRARGELGWSAEWRKQKLAGRTGSRLWRDYLAESFCDTAAWLWSGAGHHAEHTLAHGHRARRRHWFATELPRTLTI